MRQTKYFCRLTFFFLLIFELNYELNILAPLSTLFEFLQHIQSMLHHFEWRQHWVSIFANHSFSLYQKELEKYGTFKSLQSTDNEKEACKKGAERSGFLL